MCFRFLGELSLKDTKAALAKFNLGEQKHAAHVLYGVIHIKYI